MALVDILNIVTPVLAISTFLFILIAGYLTVTGHFKYQSLTLAGKRKIVESEALKGELLLDGNLQLYFAMHALQKYNWRDVAEQYFQQHLRNEFDKFLDDIPFDIRVCEIIRLQKQLEKNNG